MALFWGGLVAVPAALITFYYYSVFGLGILLAWRFHSSRILFTLLTLLLAHRALGFFSSGRAIPASGPGRIALEAVAFLLPLNFIVFALMKENGLVLRAVASRLTVLFFESVFVAVICRPEAMRGPGFLHTSFLGRQPWTHIPQLAFVTFSAAFALLLVRFLLYRKPIESGVLWSLVATLFSLYAGGVDRIASAFVATASLILVGSIIESSYLLAYHDELTNLLGRRAFNKALLSLEAPYTIAVVDIDHFKRFNDTYGHDIGDQVLRMVATNLDRVSGGGRAYRIGGEEFTILFPGKPLRETQAHLELLRAAIEASTFRLRGAEERRHASCTAERAVPERRRRKQTGEDRRAAAKKPQRIKHPIGEASFLSVTVSIGAAEPGTRKKEVEQVIKAADKALYRAKQGGRNRVEYATKFRSASQARHSVA
jgi:diguanylate cyclase (GGDEF)-like protein